MTPVTYIIFGAAILVIVLLRFRKSDTLNFIDSTWSVLESNLALTKAWSFKLALAVFGGALITLGFQGISIQDKANKLASTESVSIQDQAIHGDNASPQQGNMPSANTTAEPGDINELLNPKNAKLWQKSASLFHQKLKGNGEAKLRISTSFPFRIYGVGFNSNGSINTVSGDILTGAHSYREFEENFAEFCGASVDAIKSAREDSRVSGEFFGKYAYCMYEFYIDKAYATLHFSPNY